MRSDHDGLVAADVTDQLAHDLYAHGIDVVCVVWLAAKRHSYKNLFAVRFLGPGKCGEGILAIALAVDLELDETSVDVLGLRLDMLGCQFTLRGRTPLGLTKQAL